MKTKGELRSEMRRRRSRLSPAEKRECERRLSARLLECPQLALGPVGVYLAAPAELDLGDFIRSAFARGTLLAAPRWNGREYEFAALVAGNELVAGPHGIREPALAAPVVAPAELRAVLVPGLAFTRAGARLGYGGGWYDRLLRQCPAAWTCGVAAEFQVVVELPLEAHDCRLKALAVAGGAAASVEEVA